MNLQQLAEHLRSECYQPAHYHIGLGWGACGDTFCIDKIDGQFEIFYVERGQRGKPIQRIEDETTACKAFLAVLDCEPFARANCIGSFVVKSEADDLARRLDSQGIKVHRDEVPYSSLTDIRYRIFVFGRDQIRAKNIL